MNKSRLTATLTALAVLLPLQAEAQSAGKVRKPGGAQPSHSQAIKNQTKGQYPDFKRTTLPKGTINHQWATECSEQDTISSVIYSPERELRVRSRQLVGTVMVFPEQVSAITSGLADLISLDPYPKNKSNKSRIWVLGARAAGVDGNIAFIGREEIAGPRIYTIRVQTEGLNTVNCPDTVFHIRDATDPALEGVAANIHQKLASSMPMMEAVKVTPVEKVPLDDAANGQTDENQLAGTGRQTVDWLEGVKFDPSKLDFRWTLGGDAEADFAPDIVYSDDNFLYLKWDEKRFNAMMMPAVRAVMTTDAGKVDTPVSKVMRGNVMVVQRIANLTLTQEGIVVCVVRDVEEGS